MNRRFATLALAGLTLTAVSAGAIVTNQWFRDPFRDYQDAQKHVWRVTGQTFRGQVKQYDSQGNYLGSQGTDSHGDASAITARVMIDGQTFPLQGAGRHTLRNPKNEVIGYVELAPETPAERGAGLAAYLQRTGYDELLPVPHGDNDGAVQSIGFFGDNHEITFTLTGGPAEVHFTRTDKGHEGHLIMTSIVTKPVSGAHSPDPVFQWTQNGVSQTLHGFGATANLTLPGGIPLRVELKAIQEKR